MYKPAFGTKQQIQFSSEEDYYEFLGFLSKNDNSTRIVWENNDQQGAWGQEGRIEFYSKPPSLNVLLVHTAGNGTLHSRVNCNEFIKNLNVNHNFIINGPQDLSAIKATIPIKFLVDFDRGLKL